MAVLKLQKVRILTHSSKEAKVVHLLQSLELSEIIQKEESAANQTGLEKINRLNEIEATIKTLGQYTKKNPAALWITKTEMEEIAQSCDHQTIIQKVHELQQEITINENHLSSLRFERDQILPWKELPVSVDNLAGTSTAKVTLLFTSDKNLDLLEEGLKQADLSYELDRLPSSSTTNIPAYLIVQRKREKEVAKILDALSLSAELLPRRLATIASSLKEVKKEISIAEEKVALANIELQKLGEEINKLKVVHDLYSAEVAREKAALTGEQTERITIFTAWVPFDAFEELEQSLQKISPATLIYKVELEEGETPPVELRNSKIFSRFEAVTRVYGLPQYNEIDPTKVLAPFFIIFFGICLTDVGYGFLMFAIMSAILLFVKLDEGPKKLVRLLQWGGISAIILGWMFGGFFALTPEQAPSFLLTADAKVALAAGSEIPDRAFIGQLINPLAGNGLMTFLVIAFAAGVVHIMSGIAVDGYWKIKQKNFRDAFQDSFLWLLFLGSIIIWLLLKFTPAYYLIFVSLFSIIFFQGGVFDHLLGFIVNLGKGKFNAALMSFAKIFVAIPKGILKLYGLIGYVSDMLSYSRLMALGLSTGIIGFAMNTIAGVMADLIPIVGIVIAVFVIIFGHLLNLALSGLGAFIHSGRLQFVEFFGKFMEGGGRVWQPLNNNFKYVHLLEEKTGSE